MICSSIGFANRDQENSYGNNIYLADRLQPNDKRYFSFLLAIELMEQREVKIIVETGTARYGTENFEGDGGSTVIFADWASKNGALFYSVDIDPQAVKNASDAIKRYGKNVKIKCKDSIQFLKEFSQPIDFSTWIVLSLKFLSFTLSNTSLKRN